MKPGFIISLIGLVLALVLSCMNLFSGFELSNNSHADPQFHLLRALGMLSAAILSSSGLIFFSHKWLDQKSKALMFSGKSPDAKLFAMRSAAVLPAIIVILLSVLSLISGTISHAGRLPLLHAALGFGVSIGILVSLGFWIKLFVRLIQLDQVGSSGAV